MNEHHIVSGRWIEAMGLMALPPNVPKSLQHLSTLVDDIWYHAGDTSADVSSLLLQSYCNLQIRIFTGIYYSLLLIVLMVYKKSHSSSNIQIYRIMYDSRQD